MPKSWDSLVKQITERIRLAPQRPLLTCFAVLILLATAWLLWPWPGDGEQATYFFPPASATLTRVTVERKPTPTSFIPTATLKPIVHVVQQGEVLGIIAEQYDTTIDAILLANGLTDGNRIQIGQELVIGGANRTPIPAIPDTPYPTATPTSRFPYAAPALLSPADGAVFQGREERIVLQWASVGTLGEDEWYQLTVSAPGEGDTYSAYTKASSWVLPASLYPGDSSGLLHWTVSVVDVSDGRTTLSAANHSRKLEWR